jgi:hypothetical protein
MAFTGWSDDGDACYDTKEAAIERAKQIKAWSGDERMKIFTQRKWIPTWLARLTQNTRFDWIGYEEVEE